MSNVQVQKQGKEVKASNYSPSASDASDPEKTFDPKMENATGQPIQQKRKKGHPSQWQ
jgi:hypothetical protein